MRYALVALVLIAWPLGYARSADFDFLETVFGGSAKDSLPLVIAIHGLGDTPERFEALYRGLGAKVRLVSPRGPDKWPVGSSWFPIDDKTRGPGALKSRAAEVADFATALAKKRKARGLPIVTGFSQGGCLSYAIAAYHSGQFSAALPVAGFLPPSMPAYQKARTDFRVIGFHGEADQRIPVSAGERTVAALNRVGTSATLSTYGGLGHGFSRDLERDYFAVLRDEIDRAR